MGLGALVAAAVDDASETNFLDSRVNIEDRKADAPIWVHFAAGPHQNCAADYIADALKPLLQLQAHLRRLRGPSEVVEVTVAEAREGSENGLDRLGVIMEDILA